MSRHLDPSQGVLFMHLSKALPGRQQTESRGLGGEAEEYRVSRKHLTLTCVFIHH